ncbi:hypothetical protein KAW18_03630 [candidate division WOR-3 bacterium]|nr:hypothetical protein [candidate division WOR-3 bacterium]
MLLRDLIYEKKMLKKKIVELKTIIRYDNSETILQELFVQLELLQAKKVNLNTVNNQIKIDLAEKEVIVSTAVVIRDTMKDKMDVLTVLIKNKRCQLNKLELIKQRDSIYEEYTLLSHKIVASDLNVKIGE